MIGWIAAAPARWIGTAALSAAVAVAIIVAVIMPSRQAFATQLMMAVTGDLGAKPKHRKRGKALPR